MSNRTVASRDGTVGGQARPPTRTKSPKDDPIQIPRPLNSKNIQPRMKISNEGPPNKRQRRTPPGNRDPSRMPPIDTDIKRPSPLSSPDNSNNLRATKSREHGQQ